MASRRVWAGLWAGAALVGAGPALAAAPALPGRGLTGAVEDIPTLWGAPPMTGPTAASALAPPPEAPPAETPAPAPDVPPPPPPAPDPFPPPAADQVSAVTIAASRAAAGRQDATRCVTGPAWWKVTRGSATVWIMGAPEAMPMDTVWDDACMKLRVAAARLVIAPMQVPQGGAPGRTQLRPAKVPLSDRLPPVLWSRLALRLEDNSLRARDEMSAMGLTRPPEVAPTYVPLEGEPPLRKPNRGDLYGYVVGATPNLYAPAIVVARRLSTGLVLPANLGNPAADRALDLAGRGGKFVDRLEMSEAQLPILAIGIASSDADQATCLANVLRELDAGRSGLGFTPLIDAWARGDYTNALLRMNIMATCPYGRFGRSFWSTLVSRDVEAVDKAIKAGGTTVAVLEYDPLLIAGGVLDRLAAKGYAITPPEGLR